MKRTLVVLPTDRNPLREDLGALIGSDLADRLTDAQLGRVLGAVFAAANREIERSEHPGQLEISA